MNIRIGIGYDVHRFIGGRPLFLGGIEIPYEKGLLGHSDADVLIHAICDALLGALALGDIGKHFPDNSPEYKNIDSKILLRKTYRLIKEEGYSLVNLDSVLVLEQPRLKDHLLNMRKTLASVLETEVSNVSVKATTSEKLGFTGREEGVSAQAVVLLAKKSVD